MRVKQLPKRSGSSLRLCSTLTGKPVFRLMMDRWRLRTVGLPLQQRRFAQGLSILCFPISDRFIDHSPIELSASAYLLMQETDGDGSSRARPPSPILPKCYHKPPTPLQRVSTASSAPKTNSPGLNALSPKRAPPRHQTCQPAFFPRR